MTGGSGSMRRRSGEWRAEASLGPVWQTALLRHAPASVAKLVDARDSKSRSARSVGSIPTRGTTVDRRHLHERLRADDYPTIEDVIGKTPLVRLVRLPGADNAARGNVILGKLEGNNPAGSVKDRPAIVDDPRAPRSAARSSRATR